MSLSIAGFVTGLQAIGSIVSEPIKGWQARKSLKLEGDLKIQAAVTDAKIDKVKSGQLHEIDMEGKLLDQAGWKDEYWTIVMSIPLVMCFIPGMDGYVYDGFDVLSDTPVWYQGLLGIVIGAPFGVRKLGQAMTTWKK